MVVANPKKLAFEDVEFSGFGAVLLLSSTNPSLVVGIIISFFGICTTPLF